MNKPQLLVLITQVEYPAGDSYFLTATSRIISSHEDLDNFVKETMEQQNKDKYKVVNSIIYTVPDTLYRLPNE